MVSVLASRDMGDIVPGHISYFLHGHKFPLGEGEVIEFKGHRNISEDNVPAHAMHMENGVWRPSRTPAARALNSFINQEQGGFLYLGITDDREAHGFRLSVDQREHVRQELYNLLGDSEPPVKPQRVHVNFIPVIDNMDQLKGIEQVEQVAPPVKQAPPHKLMTCRYCWCDKEAADSPLQWMIPTFVIELVVLRRTVDDVRDYAVRTGIPVEELQEPPIVIYYKNEDGLYYERHRDSSRMLDEDDLIEKMAAVSQQRIDNILQEHNNNNNMEQVKRDNGITQADFHE